MSLILTRSKSKKLKDSRSFEESFEEEYILDSFFSDEKPFWNMDFYQPEIAFKLVPEYDGNSKTLHKFLHCCDIVHKRLKTESDKESFLEIIHTKLSGRAYDVIKYSNFDSWKDLRAAFEEQFQDRRSTEQVNMELVNASQNRNESVRDFANRIERLVSDLNGLCAKSEGDAAKHLIVYNGKTALKSFQNGLLDPVKFIVKASGCTSLQEAIAKACEEELDYKSRQPPHCLICSKIGHDSQSCYFRYSNKNIPNSNNFSRQYNRDNQTSNSYPQSSKSHFNTQAQGQTNYVPKTNYNDFQPRSVNICRYCRFQGHHISECRKKKFADNRRVQQQQQPQNTNSNSGNHKESDSKPGTSKNMLTFSNSTASQSPENSQPLDMSIPTTSRVVNM